VVSKKIIYNIIKNKWKINSKRISMNGDNIPSIRFMDDIALVSGLEKGTGNSFNYFD